MAVSNDKLMHTDQSLSLPTKLPLHSSTNVSIIWMMALFHTPQSESERVCVCVCVCVTDCSVYILSVHEKHYVRIPQHSQANRKDMNHEYRQT